MDKWKSLKSYHPIVLILLVGMILVSIARGMSIPFLAIYLSKITKLNAGEIGFMIGVGAIAGTFGGFMGGTLSDFIGRKKVIIWTLYAFAVVFLSFVFTTQIISLFTLIILLGVCISFFDPVSKALMGDLTTPERRLRVFSFRYTAFNIGFAVGPLIGAFLIKINNQLPFLFGALLYFIYGIFLQFSFKYFKYKDLNTKRKNPLSIRRTLLVIRQDRVLALYILGSILTISVMGEMSVTLSQYLKKQFIDGLELFTILMSINSLVVITLQYLLTRWMERWSPLTNIGIGSILLAFSEVIFAYSGSWTFFIIGMVIFTIGEILIVPSEYIIVDRITPEGMRGTYYGAHTFNGLGNFIGPWFGGILLTACGGTFMFNIFALLAIFGIFFFWYGQKVYDNKQNKFFFSSKKKSVI